MPLRTFRFQNFFEMEAAGGIVLVVASAIAVAVANSPLESLYKVLLNTPVEIRVGALGLHKPLLMWINDGLMAMFFLLVGLEIKREFLEGELSTRSQALLPAVAAIGGMAAPAAIYVALNSGGGEPLNGWAIPAATDIAFALGVLALLGDRVPLSLKVLLTAIAIFDDLGAIVVIAIFYTEQLSFTSLILAEAALVVLFLLNRLGVTRIAPYMIVGAILWLCVLKSGVHATLAGVALALTIPMRSADTYGRSPLKHLEDDLDNWVSFGVLPIFGFANAGVSFEGLSFDSFVEPVTLGISAGLFLGKQIGIFGTLWLMIQAGFARMPEGANWVQLYGMSVLCGIGFTMSLFIGGLAWEHSGFDAPVRLGVITGSIASAIVGSILLRWAVAAKPAVARTTAE